MPKNVKKQKNTSSTISRVEFIEVDELVEGEIYGIIIKALGNRTFIAKQYNGIEFKCRISAGKRRKKEFLVKEKSLVRVSPNSDKEGKLYEIVAVFPHNIRKKYEDNGCFDKLKVHQEKNNDDDIGILWEGQTEKKEELENFNIDDI